MEDPRGLGRGAGAASSVVAALSGVAAGVDIAATLGGGAIGALEKAGGWLVGVPGGCDGGRKVVGVALGALVTVVVLSVRGAFGWLHPALLRWQETSFALAVCV